MKDHTKAAAPKTEHLAPWHEPLPYTLIPKKSCTLRKSASIFVVLSSQTHGNKF